MTEPLVVGPVEGIGEVAAGTDLARLVADVADLADGDVVVVASKVVAKAEGRVRAVARETAVSAETVRVVARRGPTVIVRTRHGLVMAAAGVDASNTRPGTVVLLPERPDASARALRERLQELTGRNVAVVISDTSGRAWRNGQTDIAVGCAGLVVLDDHAGRVDAYGNALSVTAPAVADEVAAAADLVSGKLTRIPVTVVRGLAARVLPTGDHGTGAAALVRPEADDLFGYGAREAVLRSVAHDPDVRGFGDPASPRELADAFRSVLPPAVEVALRDGQVELSLAGLDGATRVEVRVVGRAVARAHGWAPVAGSGEYAGFVPVAPAGSGT